MPRRAWPSSTIAATAATSRPPEARASPEDPARHLDESFRIHARWIHGHGRRSDRDAMAGLDRRQRSPTRGTHPGARLHVVGFVLVHDDGVVHAAELFQPYSPTESPGNASGFLGFGLPDLRGHGP